MTLILHCGATAVTRAELGSIPVPAYTRSFRPIPYGDAVDHLVEQVHRHLGLLPRIQEFGVGKDGATMFGKISYTVDDAAGSELAVGLRGGYNKSLAWKIGGGRSMLVCDNLCFSADGFVVMRKNTTNAWADYKSLVTTHVSTLMDRYEVNCAECRRLEEVPCNLRRGFSMLGIALGEGILTPTQATVAFGDWRTPRYPEFSERNLWSLYNCVTEGLKKGRVGSTIDRHVAAHGFFQDLAALPDPKRVPPTTRIEP